MMIGFLFFLLTTLSFEYTMAQGTPTPQGTSASQGSTTPPMPPTQPVIPTQQQVMPDIHSADPKHLAEIPRQEGAPSLDDSGQENSAIVMKKNSFTYDGNEGRDPFKIFREIPIFIPGVTATDPKSKPEMPVILEKNIRTALVPNEIVVMGILYKKKDPIALVAVKGIKGLNKLKVNSPIGRNEGKVIEIRKDQIIIEQVKDFDGQKFTEKIVLKVRQKKE